MKQNEKINKTTCQNSDIFNIKIPSFLNDKPKSEQNNKANTSSGNFGPINNIYNNNIGNSEQPEIVKEYEEKIDIIDNINDNNKKSEETECNIIFNNGLNFNSKITTKNVTLFKQFKNDDIISNNSVNNYNNIFNDNDISFLNSSFSIKDSESSETRILGHKGKYNYNFTSNDFNSIFGINDSNNSNNIIDPRYINSGCDNQDINNSNNSNNINNDNNLGNINIMNINEENNNNKSPPIIIYNFNIKAFYNIYSSEYMDKKNYLEPSFIKPDYYINEYKEQLSELWSGENAIFKNISDLEKREGRIYKNIYNFLDKKKITNIFMKRKFYSDKMGDIIKTKLNKMIYEPFKKYYKNIINIKYQPKNSKNKDNNKDNNKSDYNYFLLEKPLYSIISNNTENFNNIQEIINQYNKNGSHKDLVEYLCSTPENCLKYFLFIKEDNNKMFNNINVVQFLIEQYKKGKKKESENILKDYMASFLLLSYNLKRLFYLKIGKNFKKNYNFI